MQISELMDVLRERWPSAFAKPELLASWTLSYDRVLGKYSGAVLSAAWEATERTWEKRGPPQPADILKHCHVPTKGESMEGQFNEYRPIPRADLIHCSRETLKRELAEAKFHALHYSMHPNLWTYRQNGSRGRSFPDLAKQWAERRDYIEHMLHGSEREMAA